MKDPVLVFLLLLALLFGAVSSCSGPGEEAAVTGEAGMEELAPPEDVPPELRSLRLTRDQLAKVTEWQEENRGKVLHPVVYPSFIKSILREDQHAAFDEILALGGDPGRGGPKF